MDNSESRMNPRFLAESKKGMLRQPRVIESGREMTAGFDKEKKEKKESFCFVVVEFELIFCHPCFDVICACAEFFGEIFPPTVFTVKVSLCKSHG